MAFMKHSGIQIKVFNVFVFCYPFITIGFIDDNPAILNLIGIEIRKAILPFYSFCRAKNIIEKRRRRFNLLLCVIMPTAFHFQEKHKQAIVMLYQ